MEYKYIVFFISDYLWIWELTNSAENMMKFLHSRSYKGNRPFTDVSPYVDEPFSMHL